MERAAVEVTRGKRGQEIRSRKETATRKKRRTGEGRLAARDQGGGAAQVGRRVAWWLAGNEVETSENYEDTVRADGTDRAENRCGVG